MRVGESSAIVGDEELVAVGDLRIDNRDDLCAALGLSRITSDVEIVLAAYRAWGVRCPERLLGDFAFATALTDEALRSDWLHGKNYYRYSRGTPDPWSLEAQPWSSSNDASVEGFPRQRAWADGK